ncbi:MAG: ABC transporter ATP-binding protein [Lachnospiraceae bacterium]|nr:ABC transporter ATP-binding protein [Butyrivibrio sp.]MCM1345119.1 ABC transporter ATP-binding protein [Muribaculaceae bacterium]MCM1411640.1 ABC transporter ATP-binding protein [Lachnospiraceae bacterium]
MELSVCDLTKDFGAKRAVDHVSFTLTGGVYGLLGPNGAGKTTLMKMMVDILTPSEGEVTLDGVNIHELGAGYRDKLGYMPQEIGVYKNFSAGKFLRYIAALKGMTGKAADRKIAELLELVGLQDAGRKKLGGFSGGMLRRVGIAQTLLNDPRILILDEPTAGLDPQERIRFRNIISELSENRIVLLSTHIISDMEFIAGEVIIMRNGGVLTIDTTDRLLREMEGKVWIAMVSHGSHDMLRELKGRYTIGNLTRKGDGVEVRIVGDDRPDFPGEPAKPILEDVFGYYFREGGS